MVNVTQEQLRVENNIHEVVESHLKGEFPLLAANKKVVELIREAYRNGIFSKKDLECFDHRRDKLDGSKPRTPVKFIIDLKQRHEREHVTFLHFYDWCIKEFNEKFGWRAIGSDMRGKVMIANFWQRYDCPSEPDYKVWPAKREKEMMFVEVKNLGEKHWFKVYNLRKYAKRNAVVVVGSGGLYYLYRSKTIPKLLKIRSTAYKKKWGTDCIVVSQDGANAHFNLQGLIKRKKVIVI